MSEQRTTQEPYVVSWDQIERYCRELGKMLLARKVPYIIPVIRGGMPPATIISYMTKIPIPFAINPHEPYVKIPKLEQKIMERTRSVLLDDVSGSGETFATLRPIFPKAFFVSLFGKPDGLASRDYCHVGVAQDHWICLPWGE